MYLDIKENPSPRIIAITLNRRRAEAADSGMSSDQTGPHISTMHNRETKVTARCHSLLARDAWTEMSRSPVPVKRSSTLTHDTNSSFDEQTRTSQNSQ